MIRKSPIRATDLSSYSRLAIDATTGLTDLVEAMHHNIASVSMLVGAAPTGRTTGITGLVYRSVRGITRLVGGGLVAAQCGGQPGKVAILVHGLCMNDLQWTRQGHDHAGLESSHAWLRTLRKLVFLGTPHHGAPLERGGHWIDILLGVSPYTAPFARLGKIRSAGITDLRHGYLLDEDWSGGDRFAPKSKHRHAVPLAGGVEHYAIAATTAATARGAQGRLPGDGLVPMASALGRHADPGRSLPIAEANLWIAHNTNHLDLLASAEVYQQIRQWLAA